MLLTIVTTLSLLSATMTENTTATPGNMDVNNSTYAASTTSESSNTPTSSNENPMYPSPPMNSTTSGTVFLLVMGVGGLLGAVVTLIIGTVVIACYCVYKNR